MTEDEIVQALQDFVEWMDGRGLAVTETRDYLDLEIREYLNENGWPQQKGDKA